MTDRILTLLAGIGLVVLALQALAFAAAMALIATEAIRSRRTSEPASTANGLTAIDINALDLDLDAELRNLNKEIGQ